MSFRFSNPLFPSRTQNSIAQRCRSAILKSVLLKDRNSNFNNDYRDEDHATTMLPPPLQLGITVTTSLCITAAHYPSPRTFQTALVNILTIIFRDLVILLPVPTKNIKC
jgi:hypothetical protein